MAIEERATGWLNARFNEAWRLTLLHACARYELACPVYVLMPDHIHLVLLGLDRGGSDQRTAVSFLRKHLRPALHPAGWQHQCYDHVLTEAEREQDAFRSVTQYLFDNPVRAGLVSNWRDYPFIGSCIAGFPDLDIRDEGYWELFWRIYVRLVEQR